MKQKYVLVDAMNMFHRAKHVSMRGDIDMRIGMSLHIMFNALRKSWRDLGGTHVVFCLEGRSWRKSFYEDYKANRIIAKLKKSQRELEDDELFFEAFNHLSELFLNKSNCTVLQCPVAEADDLIATWIDLHPNDEHIIVSSDSDFMQLLAPNVTIYNGISQQLVTLDGFFDDKGKQVIDKKTGKPKEIPDPQWLLFEKCIRGDKSDNIFPAYPGAREKGSKNKTGMREAFDDRDKGGFNWNNFMLQKWTDTDGKEHTVLKDYERNVHLVDLRKQPEEIKVAVVESILKEIVRNHVNNVGIHFLKFCAKWRLDNISRYPDEFANMMNAPYNGILKEDQKELVS